MRSDALKKGINLGGWLSQFEDQNPRHFDTFITKDDTDRISQWGFDSIRLPVDYVVLEDVDHPGSYIQSGFDIISQCLEWCENAGLRVILDLHKAPGYAFDEQDKNDFETNPVKQTRFVNLWREITHRFYSIDQEILAFELLNEVVFKDWRIWNVILERALREIRTIDEHRLVLFGGNYYSAVDTLGDLPELNDEQLLPKFHFYLPLSVTHQKAYWVPSLLAFDCEVSYPGKADGLGEFLEKHPDYAWRLNDEIDAAFNVDFLRRRLAPAVEFIRARHSALHCGEFGVIDRAPMQTRLNWTRDVVNIFRELGIGYAYWTYKAMDFGLVDSQGNIINHELIDILVG